MGVYHLPATPYDGTDPRTCDKEPDPAVKEHGSRPVRRLHIQYRTKHPIIRLTHVSLSIHLCPSLDQHPACCLMAMKSSAMERGFLVLRFVLGERGCNNSEEIAWLKMEAGVRKEIYRCKRGLRKDALLNCQCMGTAHPNF